MYPSTQCYGCINDKLDQLSHMECPTGCLHDPEDCPICISLNS